MQQHEMSVQAYLAISILLRFPICIRDGIAVVKKLSNVAARILASRLWLT